MNGATREILHSSAVSEWETPSGLYHALDTCLHFNLDPACTAMNAKLPLPEQRYAIDEGKDGLVLSWACHGRVFLNPPYGKTMQKWMKKVVAEWRAGCQIACLLPVRTDTRWFHESASFASRILFLRGRLRFVGAQHCAPFPSMIMLFGFQGERLDSFAVSFPFRATVPAAHFLGGDGTP